MDGLTPLWLWPLALAKAQNDMIDIAMSAQKVVVAQMPLVAAAVRQPWSADYPELFDLVEEETKTFGLSQRKLAAVSRSLRLAFEANSRDFARLMAGTVLGPADWAAIGTRNLDAWSALVNLPGVTMAPVRRRVLRNERRLSTRAGRSAKPNA